MHTTPVPSPGANSAAATLRFVAGLVEAGQPGGAVNLKVRAHGYTVEVRPDADEPQPQAASAADGKPVEAAPKKVTVRNADMVHHFLSEKERIILADLAAHPGTAASDLLFRIRAKGVEKSQFWVLWSNLQQRGLVEDADIVGVTGGFKLAVEWVADLLPSGAGSGSTTSATPV